MPSQNTKGADSKREIRTQGTRQDLVGRLSPCHAHLPGFDGMQRGRWEESNKASTDAHSQLGLPAGLRTFVRLGDELSPLMKRDEPSVSGSRTCVGEGRLHNYFVRATSRVLVRSANVISWDAPSAMMNFWCPGLRGAGPCTHAYHCTACRYL